MQRVTKPIVLGVAVVFGLGLITAAAGSQDAQGDAVRKAVMQAKSLAGAARGELVSDLARLNGDLRSDAAKADAIADKAGAKHNHGASVSAVARSDMTAAHTTGIKKVNHGGAVSAVAR